MSIKLIKSDGDKEKRRQEQNKENFDKTSIYEKKGKDANPRTVVKPQRQKKQSRGR